MPFRLMSASSYIVLANQPTIIIKCTCSKAEHEESLAVL